jgi:hypothetical protein
MSSFKENIHFKIGLAGIYHRRSPRYTVLFDGEVIAQDRVQAASEEVFYIEFDRELVERDYELTIRLENKVPTDTVRTEDQQTILQDMLLRVVSVEIDDIDLGQLRHSKSVTIPDNSAFQTLTNCVDLGWNGSWVLKFTSPFYIWILENT